MENSRENYPLIVPPDYKNHFVYDLDIESYHADKTSVSSSNLKRILKSQAAFKAYHIDGYQPESTKAQTFGSTVHMGLLEPKKFKENFVVEPIFVGRTKDGKETTSLNATDVKEKRAAWYASLKPGAVVLSEEDLKHFTGIIEKLSGHAELMSMLKGSTNEASGFYRDEETGIKCRFRPDASGLNGDLFLDFKTVLDCSEDFFERQVDKLGYNFQMAMGSNGMSLINGKIPKYHVFVAAEKIPPYDFAVYFADESVMSVGRKRYRRAINSLGEALRSDKWLAYQDFGIRPLTTPKYTMDKEGLDYDNE